MKLSRVKRVISFKTDTNKGGYMKNASYTTSMSTFIIAVASLTWAPVRADNWIGADGADWNVGSNWSGGIVPGNPGFENRVYFLNGTQAWITSSVLDPALIVSIESSGGGFDVRTGGSLTMNSNNLVMRQNATVSISGGTLTNNQRVFVGTVGTQNTLNLSSGTWNTTNVMAVGDSGGEGTVNVSGGAWNISGPEAATLGSTNNSASKGTINLSGSGQIIKSGNNTVDRDRLTVGWTGTGVFNQTGGEYQAAGDRNGLMLGRDATSSGTYSVSGGVLDLASVANASVTAGLGTARFEVTGAWDEVGVTNEIDIGGDLTLNTSSSTLAFNLDSTGIEQIMVGNNADLSNATLEIALADGYNGADLLGGNSSRTFNLLFAGNAITTTGLTLVDNLGGGLSVSGWEVVDTNSQTLMLTVIPEPSTIGLVLMGLLAVAAGMRRRK